jgi:hypothetical protein
MTSTDGRAERLTFVASRPGGKMATDDVSLKIMAVGTTSEFDPLLCEAAIRWWSPAGGVILDPFAGGSVRGIVSGILGREYHGVDLSVSQVTANERTLARLAPIVDILEPQWYTADSSSWQPDIQADYVFSCPPYGSLEKYSDDPGDLSNMKFEDFSAAYRRAIAVGVRSPQGQPLRVFRGRQLQRGATAARPGRVDGRGVRVVRVDLPRRPGVDELDGDGWYACVSPVQREPQAGHVPPARRRHVQGRPEGGGRRNRTVGPVGRRRVTSGPTRSHFH